MIPAGAMFSVLLLSNMATPIYPIWQHDIGFSPAVVNVLFSVYQVGVLIGLLGLGKITDRMGWRVSLIGATILGFSAALVFGSASAAWQLAVARFLCGLASGIVLACGAAAVAAVLDRPGRQQGPAVAALATTVGLATGPLAGGLFADHLPEPTRLIFALGGGLLAIACGFLIFARRFENPALSQIKIKESGIEIEDPKPESSFPLARRNQLRFSVSTVFAACYITSGIFLSIGSVYLLRELNVTSATIAGLLVFVVFGSASCSQFPASRMSPLIQASTALLLCGLGASFLIVGVVFHWMAGMVLAAVFSGSAQGIAQLVGLTVVRRITPLIGLRRAYARLNTVGYAAGGGSIIITIPIVLMTGVGPAIVAIAIGVMLITAFSAITVHSKREAFHSLKNSEVEILPIECMTR